MSLLEFRIVRCSGRPKSRRCRSGFSMFEVMVAMAVCVSGIVLIIGMMQTAENFTKRAQTRMTQQLLCQNLMNQVLLGIIEPREMRREECRANEDFWYSMKVNPYPHLPMQRIEVAVWPKSKTEQTGRSKTDPRADLTSRSDQTVVQSDDDGKKFILVSLLPVSSLELSNSQLGRFGIPTSDVSRQDNSDDKMLQLGRLEQIKNREEPPW
ncbi:MAG: hypothetical protein KF851_10665 [Pirellulaceae bacterium]|nr:hypothetical protein [Pirellulaceae bacterium]